MTHTFYKYQGTGNDFVIMDNRNNSFDKENTELIAKLCDRRFGIGADGLMLLEDHDTADFTMVYFNADGNESTMCGNGGRCLVAFAKHLGLIQDKAIFEAVDGMHHAIIEGATVKLQMQDVRDVEQHEQHVFLDTGSPHHVMFKDNLDAFNVKTEGALIRNGEPYYEAGTNVNFVEKIDDHTFGVRTYERGVEDETLSCGTGVTAVAIAMYAMGATANKVLTLKTKGGDLKVSFIEKDTAFKEVWLMGPATQVFKGTMVC